MSDGTWLASAVSSFTLPSPSGPLEVMGCFTCPRLLLSPYGIPAGSLSSFLVVLILCFIHLWPHFVLYSVFQVMFIYFASSNFFLFIVCSSVFFFQCFVHFIVFIHLFFHSYQFVYLFIFTFVYFSVFYFLGVVPRLFPRSLVIYFTVKSIFVSVLVIS